MSKNKRTVQIYRSMAEFEKVFLPQYYKKKMLEVPRDVQALGTSLAKESLNKIRFD